ncbi:hypothetical protein BCR41DRAFT_128238 [Lobosporangium transversale]|uniref:FAD-binding domain-containing protein n=1 Tax=Lobosporangium transversale TaxID=64571 RepID=A0A1Y2GL32_9FUNG|nr:hypothetical protein BCR41DRAFT_128238 [Lobosporangium transversale]ORZ10631.1 hypothetical protein BCR41DRAFT_128238 [Lobosporangium transversale]|eukprot:XP_021879352.1 hypothetical protein BCR41DRAFT_128238 [Lobosporangium transversale]
MWLSAVSGNRITWCVTGPLLTCNKSEQNFMVSQYGPEEVDKACQLIEDLETPFGGKLGDLIAETPRENITKILVEEKHYKTWYHGRTVLIGEACHKFVSFAGQGAEQAILDAVCLANLFSKIQSPYPLEAIVEAFEAYQETRLPLIKICMQSAGQTAKALNDQGLASDMKRRILFNLPLWMRVMSVDKTQVRPQLEFLPFVPDRGSRSIRTASLKSV